MSATREQLLGSRARSIFDIPDAVQLDARQERARQSVVTGTAQRSPNVETELNKIVAPAHFIDFETLSPALPVYPGTRPYETVPFQWSDHILDRNGGVTHSEFLADRSGDPRERLPDLHRTWIRFGGRTTATTPLFDSHANRWTPASSQDLATSVAA